LRTTSNADSIPTARRVALRAFGGVQLVKDEVRDSWGATVVDTLGQDLEFGMRHLTRRATPPSSY
jgi:hypothetical protein